MISINDIITEGSPCLSKIAKKVKLPLSDDDLQLGLDLLEYIKNSQDEKKCEDLKLKPAVGIAAPQVNVSKQIFAIHFQDFNGDKYSFIVINPKIITKSIAQTFLPDGEGCLSVIREVEGITKRALEIEVEFDSLDFKTKKVSHKKMTLKRYPAIVFQHEYDHLQGILFTDKLSDKTSGFSVFDLYPELNNKKNID